PATDDKVLADWNGMVIGGLATAGRLLPEPLFVERAVAAAEAVLSHLRRSDGVLLHSWRQGRDGVAAFLSDYAFLVRGLLALDRATSDERWLEAAIDLTEEQIDRLADPLGGFFNAAEGDDLLVRPKEIVDGALPAANAVACLDLLELAERTREGSWRERAEATLRAFASQVEQRPEGARMMAVAVARAGGTEGAEARESPSGTPMQARAAQAVEAHLGLAAPDADGWRSFELDLKIGEGLHLNAHPASLDFLVPPEVSASDLELDDVVYPEGEPLEASFAERPIAVYRGEVRIEGRLRGEGELHLAYQACSEHGCLPVVRIDLPVGSSA
ncbi:MAG: hypothetical protein R3244_01670, partial [Thermoanaerobaculia bacterium]|nr:hypothetical protein [Thermoanaerobaculia bacterium]